MLPNIYNKKVGRHAKSRSGRGPMITTPGLALSAVQLNERIINGTAQVVEKQPIYEAFYDIDNPNPLRRPDIDLVDVKAHSDYLSQHYEQMQKHYDDLVKKAKEAQKVKDASATQQNAV